MKNIKTQIIKQFDSKFWSKLLSQTSSNTSSKIDTQIHLNIYSPLTLQLWERVKLQLTQQLKNI